ncbi:hypothetical protein TVAG_442100 [Trichomonas vaginalis G3]|uniref:Rab-GAP TBC domain-containing protein n=1 Tax=Trichomonas vaginalis (strain ATCC PRA-98 / G3) TaxID=412133 RepID=A2F1V4_TRIV3|nr:regulation of vesicle fusion [Trichomonas vaginalis G3]EAY01099.1 hypothetical protein TVAG_442100 [Trichomonas vaginalis G3]KAI5517416.1 regulation of vesicle fusion [Trichomonas vaginalis G3]|eukprot:XP_001313951.1 hypothetical protein [Trichomonas vaginalis G3]
MSMFGPGSTIDYSISNDDHYMAQIAKHVGADAVLNKKTLVDIITNQYCFPDDQRVLTWRYLLHIPMNEQEYTLLASQQLHPAVRQLTLSLPIRYTSISNRLSRLLSTLMYWHPALAECDWLPALVFPFLRVFERDSLITFEIVATVIMNWCKEWLNFIPNPPITVLSRIDRIVAAHGGKSPISVTWPALRSFFGEVATTEAALILFDNIITSHPCFIEYLVASFAMIKGNKVVDVHNYKIVINRARQFFEEDENKNLNLEPFHPLPRGSYPIISIVKKTPLWKEQELARIKLESEQEQKKDEEKVDIERESALIERRRRNWMAERTVLREIEEEQMAEFRRREKEILMRENQKEELNLEIKRERLRKRRIEEENAMDEWRADCAKVQNEMRQIVDSRRQTWSKWINTKENAAKLAHEQVEEELEMIRQRDEMRKQEILKHDKAMEEGAREEQEILNLATQRSQQLEDERFKLRETLEMARRKSAEKFSKKGGRVSQNN